MTPAPSLIGLFVAPLNRAGIEYMVTGGLAAVMYGHPRLTLDVDLVLRLSARDAVAFSALWPPEEFYSPPAEVIEAERAMISSRGRSRIESSARCKVRPSSSRRSNT